MKAYRRPYLLLSLVLFLCIFGMVIIYSASSYSANINYGDSMYFVKKQIWGFSLGIVLFIIASRFDYHKYVRYRFVIISVAVILLVLVFVPFIGVTNNGARRWINVFGLSLQSSEVAKFSYVIFLACYMTKYKEKMKTFVGMLVPLAIGGLICMLVLLEPNLSVTLCIGAVMICMLVIGGISLKNFLILLIPALCLVPILIIMEPYRMQRLVAYLDPWSSPRDEGFQLIQSLYSLGAGGLFGVGVFNSRQKYLFLPFSESDFIFSIIGEEFGFVGAILIIFVYVLIIREGVKIAYRSKDRLGAYMAFGIVCVIAIQTLINIAVVTGSIPPTGIPLPFVSAGGTSLSVFMMSIGVLCNISKGGEVKAIFNKSIFHKKQSIPIH